MIENYIDGLCNRWDAGEITLGDAIREAIQHEREECAKLVEAQIGSLAVSRDRARAAGRDCVASCRQSDMETCERIAARIRVRESKVNE